MSWFNTEGIQIAGIASAVPAHTVGEEENSQKFGSEDVEKFIKNTGIKSLHRTTELQTAADLGFVAAEKLFAELSVDKSEIGCLVLVTQSPDYRRPNTACVLQNRLGLPMNCACFDVNQGCAGFVYGHAIMKSMMAVSDMKYGLLITAETSSKISGDYSHAAMMFGDAGAAILYSNAKILGGGGDNNSTGSRSADNLTTLGADGKRYRAIIVPAGGFRDMYPSRDKYTCSDGVARSKYELYMNGIAVFGFSIMEVNEYIKEFLAKTGTTIDDYDVCAFHQANYFILKQLAKRLSIPQEKLAVSLDRFGNTSSASIPLTLCDRFGEEHSGGVKHVLAAGFGVGLAWGVTAFDVDTDKIFPVIETDDYFADGIIDMTRL